MLCKRGEIRTCRGQEAGPLDLPQLTAEPPAPLPFYT